MNLQFNKYFWEIEVAFTEFGGSYNPSSLRIQVMVSKRMILYHYHNCCNFNKLFWKIICSFGLFDLAEVTEFSIVIPGSV